MSNLSSVSCILVGLTPFCYPAIIKKTAVFLLCSCVGGCRRALEE